MDLRFGLDLVPVSAVRDSMGQHGAGYIQRIYTAAEIEASGGAHGADPSRLAERFAVKEATLKVLPAVDEGLDFRSIELVCRADGSLEVVLHGRAAELAAAAGVTGLRVSVTRDDRLAAAVVAAEIGSA